MTTSSLTTQAVILTVISGSLCTPVEAITNKELREFFKGDDPILCDRDETGDVITASWPIEDGGKNLRILLFGAREQGLIPDVKSVLLPDGSEFVIDGPEPITQAESTVPVVRVTIHFPYSDDGFKSLAVEVYTCSRVEVSGERITVWSGDLPEWLGGDASFMLKHIKSFLIEPLSNETENLSA